MLVASVVAACSSSSPGDPSEATNDPEADAGPPSQPNTPDPTTPDGGGDTTDGGPSTPKAGTATIVFDGVTSTVVPNVRRGLAFAPPLAEKQSSADYGQGLVLTCSPGAGVARGGRVLMPNLVTISGNITGNCATNPGQIPGAETQIRSQIRAACSGTSTCTFDPTSAMQTYLAECSPQNLRITTSYACPALDPAPSFVIETSQPNLAVTAIDGLGTASCTERNARFLVNGALVTPDAGSPCTITITKRTERSLAGTISATLPGSPTPRALTIDFEHDGNILRPTAGLHLGADVCATNSVTRSVRTEGAEVFDDFTTGPLVCSVNQPTTPITLSFSRRRPNASSSLEQQLGCRAGRLDVAVSGVGSTAAGTGGCDSTFEVAESADVLQVVAHNLTLCDPANPGSCQARPIAYLSLGLTAADAP